MTRGKGRQTQLAPCPGWRRTLSGWALCLWGLQLGLRVVWLTRATLETPQHSAQDPQQEEQLHEDMWSNVVRTYQTECPVFIALISCTTHPLVTVFSLAVWQHPLACKVPPHPRLHPHGPECSASHQTTSLVLAKHCEKLRPWRNKSF